MLNKARKSLNILKVISHQKWGQDTRCLRTLAIALVRSKLSYAQEVFFNAPPYLLKKLESIDCKSFKIALGVPYHSSNIGTYQEANILPLDYFRKGACTKFVFKVSSTDAFCKKEVSMTSEKDFTKRAINLRSALTIKSFISDLLLESNLQETEIVARRNFPSIPSWCLMRGFFQINTNTINKELSPHIIKSIIDEEMELFYKDYTKIYTDGSVLSNGNSGAAFLIPSLRVTKSFHLGKHFSIFTAELCAIREALKYYKSSWPNTDKLLLCVDSISVLLALKGGLQKIRTALIDEILQLVHYIVSHNVSVTFYWVPSHCGIQYNERVDTAAKKGAENSENSIQLSINLDYHEIRAIIDKLIQNRLYDDLQKSNHFYSLYCTGNSGVTSHNSLPVSIQQMKCRKMSSLMFKLRLNAPRTKFKKNIHCPCGEPLSTEHILTTCSIIKNVLKTYYTTEFEKSQSLSIQDILNDFSMLKTFAEILSSSCISNLF